MTFDPEALARLKSVASSRQGTTFLSFCDPPMYGFGPPRQALEALQEGEPAECFAYPDFRGLEELLARLITDFKERFGCAIAPENLLVTNGLHEAFSFVGIAGQGGAFAVQDPGYLPMISLLQHHGAVVAYPCEEANAWRPDLDALRRVLAEQPAVQFLFLINPNNPTGATYPPEDLQRLAEIALEHDVVLVGNEVYEGLAEDGFSSVLECCGDAPVLYLNGFSKTFRLAGLRLGYMAFSDPRSRKPQVWESITRLAKLHYGVNPLVQRVALAAMDETEAERARVLQRLWDQKAALLDAVAQSRYLDAAPVSGNTFVFARVPVNDLELCERLLEERECFVYPGSAMGERGRNHICLVCLQPTDVLVKGVATIDEVIAEMR